MTSPLENITIYNPVGTAYGNFPVTDSAERSSALMGDDFVRLVFVSETRTIFDAFSFIVYEGKHFFLKETYRPTPKGTHYAYDVKFVSVGNMLHKHICMRHYQVSGQTIQPEPEINVNCSLDGIMDIVMRGIVMAYSRVPLYKDYVTVYSDMLKFATLGTLLDNTELKTFCFEGMYADDVLTEIAGMYESEWWIDEFENENHSLTFKVHLCKCEDNGTAPYVVSDTYIYTPKALHPYQSRGLLSCEYAQEWGNIPQRILPYGSDRNITREQALDNVDGKDMYVSYGKRLRLAPSHTYSVTTPEGGEDTLETDASGSVINPGVQSGIEKVEMFDSIYPQGHYVVTQVTQKANGVYVVRAQAVKLNADGTPKKLSEHAYDKYTDAEMSALGILPLTFKGFDESPYCLFESGYLNGRQFDINVHAAYVGSTRVLEFAIVPEGDLDDPLRLPTDNFHPVAESGSYEGDLFALFNIDMPTGYNDTARQQLAQATYEKLLEYQASRPDVKCVGDPTVFSAIPVGLGLRFSVYSELFGVVVYDAGGNIDTNKSTVFTSRVIAYSHSLTKPQEVEFTLASSRVAGSLATMEALIADKTSEIRDLQQRSVNISTRAWHDAAEMAEMLESLTAELMLVGVERYQFAFTFGIQCTNQDNAFMSLRITTGYLQHTQKPWIDYTNGGRWENIGTVELDQDENGSGLDDNTPYYLYAIVEDGTDSVSGFALVSRDDTIVGPDDQEHPKYYDDDHYLLLGILSSIFPDEEQDTKYRVFNRSNGYTQIAGGTITTEQIQDATRSLIIDFSSNPPRIIARNGAEIIGDIRFSPSEAPVSSRLASLDSSVSGLGVNVGQLQNAMTQANREIAATNALVLQVQDDLQSQIDGEISTWFGIGLPYNSSSESESESSAIELETDFMDCYPATEWLSEESYSESDSEEESRILKRHVGDLYYDRSTGFGFRFAYDSTIMLFGWMVLRDADALRALELAAEAKRTAEDKVTIYSGNTEPTPPYKVGDMWQKYSDGKVLYTTVTRQAGESFHASDWVSSSEYAEMLALMEAGGENLLFVNNQSRYYDIEEGDYDSTFIELTYNYLNNGQRQHTLFGSGTYVFSADNVTVDVQDEHADILLFLCAINASGSVHQQVAVPSGKVRNLQIVTTESCYFSLRVICDGQNMQGYCEGYESLSNMQLQAGEKSTAFQSYIRHLVSALKGTTDIAGGLVMTNVLMLKNESNNVTAGMSGLVGTQANPENVLMWSGGDYQKALDTIAGLASSPCPVIISKDGLNSRIGCFRVKDKDTIAVDNGEMTVYVTTKSVNDTTIAGNLVQDTVSQSHSGNDAYSGPEIDVQIPLAADSFYSIEDFNIEVVGFQATSQYPLGGTARVSVLVTLGGVVLTDAVGHSMNEQVTSGIGTSDARHYEKIEGSSAIAQTLRIRCYDIFSSRGSYAISFKYKAGAEADFRCCVIAKDGLMISSGHNKQFYVKPDLSNLHLLCNLPPYNANLQIGELYVDDAGFVRQRVYGDDEPSGFVFKLGVGGTKSGTLKRGRLDLSDFYQVILPS